MPAKPYPAMRGVHWTVLVVEDEALIAAATESLLFELGAADVMWARDIDEAERLLDRTAPSLAVVDWLVGRRTSEQLIARLAAASIGTLVLTGAAFDEISLPVDRPIEILGKPALDTDIAAAVDRLLRNASD